jgi:hypothetical protein
VSQVNTFNADRYSPHWMNCEDTPAARLANKTRPPKHTHQNGNCCTRRVQDRAYMTQLQACSCHTHGQSFSQVLQSTCQVVTGKHQTNHLVCQHTKQDQPIPKGSVHPLRLSRAALCPLLLGVPCCAPCRQKDRWYPYLRALSAVDCQCFAIFIFIFWLPGGADSQCFAICTLWGLPAICRLRSRYPMLRGLQSALQLLLL